MSPTTWKRVVCEVGDAPLDPELLRGLIRGDHGVIVLKGLLPSAEFTANRRRVLDMFHHASTARYHNGALTTIGPYLARYMDNVADYFTAAEDNQAVTSAAGFDLDVRVRARLAEVFGLDSCEPAEERDGRRYAPSILRIHADGVRNPLHNDNIMRDGAESGLSIAKLLYQLSCVVCVQECDEGGELQIYRRPWSAADEAHKVTGGLGYHDAVTAGAESDLFKPETEDVYLINPTNYHEIHTVGGADRLTLGFFVGFYDDELRDAVTWS
ncbi:hypothetical protein R8Z50_20465 [Longispora sp. K20-0274]|uniref:2OG-Fe(II)-dependent halogenase WelO5 family protein n=1 Tax=Longispora sp. K20-0274 TaxID=3088255 RepID=UPI003999959F